MSVFIFGFLLGIAPLKNYAEIKIQVTGGIDTPLTVEILQGGDFLTTAPNASTFAIVFENFWNNTVASFDLYHSVDTIQMEKASRAFFTGTFDEALISPTDLTLSFVGAESFIIGETLTLGLGIRTTQGKENGEGKWGRKMGSNAKSKD